MKADLILSSDAVFDSINEEPFEGYVAIKGNKIISVGKGTGFQNLADDHTEVLNYNGKTIMAGFHDSHTHLLMAGMFRIYVNLINARSEEEAALMTKEFTEDGQDESAWIIGFQWYHVFWDNRTLPTKASLDKYFPDKPVCLINAEAHGAWVNSKALELAGITEDTPDPFGGKIARFENGEPTGFLYESAVGLVGKHAFAFTPEQERKIIKSYLEGAAKYGITSINDVQPYFHGNMGNIQVYSDLDQRGELTIRIHAAPDLLGDLEEVERWREKYQSEKLKIDMLKQFLDGVATTHTALILEDYADESSRGISLNDVEAIKKAVPEGHRRGFSIKLHACGDASARLALDYYEHAIKMHGKNGTRHAIEHIEMLSEQDLPRFKELGIIPSVQPEHIALTQNFEENPYPIVLGEERADRTWPLKSLYDTAGLLAIGSDCPVVDNNPFLEIYRGVTRLHNDGKPEGGWNPQERLTVYEVLRSYTYGSAYGVRREGELGSLREGMLADVIVIDRDLFKIPPSALMEGKVILTVMDGKIIYRK